MCREFIIMINSDVFKNLLIFIVNSKVELMLKVFGLSEKFFGLSEKYCPCPLPPKKKPTTWDPRRHWMLGFVQLNFVINIDRWGKARAKTEAMYGV